MTGALTRLSIGTPAAGLWSSFYKGVINLAKLSCERLETLHNSRNEWNFVRSVGALTTRTATIVFDPISRHLGGMMRLNYSMFSAKKRYFLSLSVTSAMLKSERTLRTWAMCSHGDLGKVTMLFKYTRSNYQLTANNTTPPQNAPGALRSGMGTRIKQYSLLCDAEAAMSLWLIYFNLPVAAIGVKCCLDRCFG